VTTRDGAIDQAQGEGIVEVVPKNMQIRTGRHAIVRRAMGDPVGR
jgi:hypothetical protein